MTEELLLTMSSLDMLFESAAAGIMAGITMIGATVAGLKKAKRKAMGHRLVPLDAAAIDRHPDKSAVFGRILDGEPRESFLSVFDNHRDGFACGVWQCTPGLVAMVDWPQDELCVLVSGRVIITPKGGVPQEFREGDAFAIPKGFTGTWDVQETIRKYYAIRTPSRPARVARRIVGAPVKLARRLVKGRAQGGSGSFAGG